MSEFGVLRFGKGENVTDAIASKEILGFNYFSHGLYYESTTEFNLGRRYSEWEIH